LAPTLYAPPSLAPSSPYAAHTLGVWQGKVSAGAMFNEVDVDGDGGVTMVEWDSFWKNVLKNGYEEAEVLEELDGLIKGEAWVDFDDGRTT